MTQPTLQRKVEVFIRQNRLLKRNGRYLVALSGGADSVALLLFLRKAGFSVEAAHCNFRLRGAESDRDEAFCRRLCDREQVPVHLAHFDTRTYASLHKVSIEMAARVLRYRYFEQLRHDIQADGICVAHHRDDSVETVLINLVRGTGIHGLTGIAAESGHVLRPFLCISRKEILEYLQFLGQDYVTDSTNLVDDVQRNIVRLDVLPLLERLNPAVRENVDATARRLSDAACLLDSYMQRDFQWRGKTGTVRTFPLQAITHEYIVWYLLHGYGFTPAQTENIFVTIRSIREGDSPRSAGQYWQSEQFEVAIGSDSLCLAERVVSLQSLSIPEPGIYVLSDGVKLRVTVEQGAHISTDPASACVDADAVVWPLTVRPCAKADRFVPFGMKGSKLVSDFLTDSKLSILERRRQLVVTEAGGRIVWLPLLRTDNRFRVGPSTRSVIRITLERDE